MRTMKLCCLLLALAVLALTSPAQLNAATAYVKHQNLAEMTDEATMIYRGKVVSITGGTVAMAGGELPTVTFMIEVTESLRGKFIEKGGKRYAELTVPGAFHPVVRKVGEFQQRLVLPDPPGLRVGQEYLLLTNSPNKHGLSNTIGMAQGCFHIRGAGKTETVVNGANNAGLFHGMDAQHLAAAATELSYADLVQRIHTEMDG